MKNRNQLLLYGAIAIGVILFLQSRENKPPSKSSSVVKNSSISKSTSRINTASTPKKNITPAKKIVISGDDASMNTPRLKIGKKIVDDFAAQCIEAAQAAERGNYAKIDALKSKQKKFEKDLKSLDVSLSEEEKIKAYNYSYKVMMRMFEHIERMGLSQYFDFD